MKTTRKPSSSLYPLPVPGSSVLARIPEGEITALDRFLVMTSSLAVVGSVVWVPLAYAWAWRRWKKIPREQKRRRMVYATLLLSLAGIAAIGPHRSHRIGKWLQLKRWRLWKAWLRFVAFEVIADNPSSLKSIDLQNDQAIVAVVPHGIFPFSLGFSVLTDIGTRVFGNFRPVVATATKLVPFLRSILSWLHSVDASRPSVDRALSQRFRIGLAPGGIAEMFEGYPKPNTHPDEEYAILNSRKGFVRLACKHGIPVLPVYCFGATKMFKRLQLPAFFEQASNLFRISICVFFGSWGLPMPFRQKLLYVLGRPIFPPRILAEHGVSEGNPLFEEQVNLMHSQFCDELKAIFDRHKSTYGWDRKTLRLV